MKVKFLRHKAFAKTYSLMACYSSISPPPAEYVLALLCQFDSPLSHDGLGYLLKKWIVRDTTTRRLPYWANGLVYPSWNR